ncbi:MAG TPA: hypothetical protein VF175_19695 [Lacipirellula sp.]
MAGKGSGETAGGSPGVSSNTPSSKTISSGGEDWLELSLYLTHQRFDQVADLLDRAKEAAEANREGDELVLGDQRFLVLPGTASAGEGKKRIAYRWRLRSECGLVLNLMHRAFPHRTMPNGIARATSLLLMKVGVREVWRQINVALACLDIQITRNKVSRVDPCVDLPGVPVTAFTEPFCDGHYATRARASEEHYVELSIDVHRFGQEPTGFTVGKGGLKVRVYDKVRETGSDLEKLEVLIARRWGEWTPKATRVEFQLRREKLKELGVNSFEDWLEKRSAVLAKLTTTGFRLVQGPVDRQHVNRAPIHPIWERVQTAFEEWTGPAGEAELAPLPTVAVPPSQLIQQVVGLFVSVLARRGYMIDGNEAFAHEAMCLVLDSIEERDMAAEVKRRVLELGFGNVPLLETKNNA